MAFETARLGKPFLTVDTAVRLLARVRPDVCLEVATQSELTAAQNADIGAFTSVDTRVDTQCVGALEELAAQWALVRLLVAGGHPPDRLSARCWWFFAAVDLHVAGKAVRAAELLLASRAAQ